MVRSGASVVALAALLACSPAYAQAADPQPANSTDAAPAASSPNSSEDDSGAKMGAAIGGLLHTLIFGDDPPAPAPVADPSVTDTPAPAPPIDPDDAALAPLADRAVSVVKGSCEAANDNRPRQYHQCVRDFASSAEFARMVKLTADDQSMIIEHCAAQVAGVAALACLKEYANDAAGIPLPPAPVYVPPPPAPEPTPAPPPPLTLNDHLGNFYAAIWAGFCSFCVNWCWFLGSSLVLLFVWWASRPGPAETYPPATDEPSEENDDSYFSGAASDDFKERSPFGDGDMSDAEELNRAMEGANSHGEPPFFEE